MVIVPAVAETSINDFEYSKKNPDPTVLSGWKMMRLVDQQLLSPVLFSQFGTHSILPLSG
jgi:hypothetical protein